VTISPPHSSQHSVSHSYPIAIGCKDGDRTCIEHNFAAEFKKFSSGESLSFYCGNVKGTVSLQDQPERRSANYIMLGRSNYTVRWVHALDFAAVASEVPACSRCKANLLLHSDHNQGQRENCVNWDTDVKSGLLDFYPPPNFPVDCVLITGKLSPMRLSYESMRNAIAIAREECWTNDNATASLRVCGINKEVRTAILRCASNKLLYKQLLESPEGNESQLRAMIEDKEENPDSYRMWKYPTLWDQGVELHQHIDVAMHLLFLGVTKTTMQMIQDWAKKRGKYAQFINATNGVLEAVQQLQLDWC
jgi:hypothetical protein